jgi:hypothetical protein
LDNQALRRSEPTTTMNNEQYRRWSSAYNRPQLQLEQEFDFSQSESGANQYTRQFPAFSQTIPNNYPFNPNLQSNTQYTLDSSYAFDSSTRQNPSFPNNFLPSQQPQQLDVAPNYDPAFAKAQSSMRARPPTSSLSPPDSTSLSIQTNMASGGGTFSAPRPPKGKRARTNDIIDEGREDEDLEMADTKEKPVKPGACARCKNLKVRCEFKTDTDPCKRCLNGGHECVIPGRKKRRTPPKREHLLNEIQKQAEEIQKLMAKLSELEEANKRKGAMQSAETPEASSLGSPPILSPSSGHSPYFSSDLASAASTSQASPESSKDVENWIAKARESLAEFGGFIGIGGASMPKKYFIEQDPEGLSDSGGDSDLADLDGSLNDEEFEFAIVDDEGDEWSPRDAERKRGTSKRLSGSSNGSVSLKKKDATEKPVTIPNEAVPFGLLADLAYKNQRKRGSVSEAEVEADEPGTETTGVANANFFRPSPGPDPARTLATNPAQVPHILARGVITPDDAENLFTIFFDLVNPSVSIVDPVLYTALKTVHRSPFLFTTICAISSRFYDQKPGLYVQVMNYAQLAAGTALIGGPKNVEMCIAYILLSLYPPPLKRWEESRGWLYLGVAIRIATELNLHLPITAKPLNEMHAREQLNRTRVWLNCFNLDRSTGSQNGKPPIISNNDYIANHSEDWWKSSPYNMKNFDIQLCCYNSELRVMAKFRSKIYNNPAHPTGLSKVLSCFCLCFCISCASTGCRFREARCRKRRRISCAPKQMVSNPR